MKRSGTEDIVLKYEIPCWNCGIKIIGSQYIPTLRTFCVPCEKEYNEKKASDTAEYVRLKAILMHERALRMLEKQKASVYAYKEASEAVLDFALMPGERFSSAHEMLAAMELIRKRIKVKTQQSVGKYRVDFMLPDLQVILEVDGYMHKTTKIKDSQRDIDIRLELGNGWEVVRIATNHIEEQLNKLTTAIDAIAEYKRDVRSKHNGILPEWYSSREMNHYSKVIDRKFKESFE